MTLHPLQPLLNMRPMRNLKAAIDPIMEATEAILTTEVIMDILLVAMIVKIMEFPSIILLLGRILQPHDLKTKIIQMLVLIKKLIITIIVIMKEVLLFNLHLRGVVHLDKRPR